MSGDKGSAFFQNDTSPFGWKATNAEYKLEQCLENQF